MHVNICLQLETDNSASLERLSCDSLGALDSHGFMNRLTGARHRTWDGLHVSPRAAPSKRAKLCTYHDWFGRPNKVHCEPYYEHHKASGFGAVSVGVTFFAC